MAAPMRLASWVRFEMLTLQKDWAGAIRMLVSNNFFPRVRTPCGHGAQLIVEGREEQSDGGEKNKDTQTNQNKQTTAHRPSLDHLVVFPLC